MLDLPEKQISTEGIVCLIQREAGPYHLVAAERGLNLRGFQMFPVIPSGWATLEEVAGHINFKNRGAYPYRGFVLGAVDLQKRQAECFIEYDEPSVFDQSGSKWVTAKGLLLWQATKNITLIG